VNTGLTPVTLHRNSKIAIVELINDAKICSAIESEGFTPLKELQELLLALSPTTIKEKDQFIALMPHYSDVVAVNSEELQ